MGEGAMAAILGIPSSEVAEICRKAADNDVVSAANLNSPEQTVISGSAAAVKRAHGDRFPERSQTRRDSPRLRSLPLRRDGTFAEASGAGPARGRLRTVALSP